MAVAGSAEQRSPAPATLPVEFHGYMRSGFGINGKGGDQESFVAPGTGIPGGPAIKYRLGNETDTYGTAALVVRWKPRPGEPLELATQVRVAYLTRNNVNWDEKNDIILSEAFGQLGGFLPALPALKVWAGKRFYRRHEVHIIDIFFLDMSAHGGGFEDLPAGAGKFAAAYLGTSNERERDMTERGRSIKHSLDLRAYDIPVPLGSGTFWLQLSQIPGGEMRMAGAQRAEVYGLAGGFIHDRSEPGGFNKLAVQFGIGAAADFDATYRNPAGEEGARRPSVQDAWRLRILDNLTIQPSERLSLSAVALVQKTESEVAAENGDWKRLSELWLSAGARPVVHFGDHLSLATEAGVDYVEVDGASGPLAKFTVAPQVGAAPTFFARPVVRAYFTYAVWGDGLRGRVARDAYGRDTSGTGMGVQLESWW
jgi:maltoporin